MSPEENPQSSSTLLYTFLAGAALGAVVAALVTPKTGREARQDLLNLGKQSANKAKELGGKVSNALVKTRSVASETLAGFKRGLQDAANGINV
jgi:gas vesicle protein